MKNCSRVNHSSPLNEIIASSTYICNIPEKFPVNMTLDMESNEHNFINNLFFFREERVVAGRVHLDKYVIQSDIKIGVYIIISVSYKLREFDLALSTYSLQLWGTRTKYTK